MPAVGRGLVKRLPGRPVTSLDTRTGRNGSRPAGSIRIVAYNFLSGGSAVRAGHWSRLIDRLAPDVVLAQECRTPPDSPGERFRAGPTDTLLWAPAGARRWGSAILLRGVQATPLKVPGFPGWVVAAEVGRPPWAPGRALRLVSVHCPVGERGYVRTLHQILDRVTRLRDDADLVLGGDFNVVVGNRQPTERLIVSRGEREILDRLSVELDLISCWQAAHPGRPLAQTLRWSADRIAPYHCDGIFVPSAWGARLAACRVVTGSRWARLSDHNPIVADFVRVGGDGGAPRRSRAALS
jgi:endonuclease/exonuclease/phosphatase family metal-dependent hydrolase